jgi:hypothetical protein
VEPDAGAARHARSLLRTLLLVAMSAAPAAVLADDAAPPSVGERSPWTLSAYVEPYYSFDFDRPLDNERPPFIYNYDRAGELNLNLGLLRGAYASDRLRGTLGIAAGTYMDANYAAEADGLQNLFEGSVGVKLAGQADLWLDAGVFLSHIGFESPIGRDNWTLTRSLGAENTPYYEAGLKLGYRTADGQWFVSGLLLNGWQRIQRPDGNTTPAFGWQVTWTPSAAITINSSSFIGNDFPDAERRVRYFHGLYAVLALNDRWGLTLGLDTGAQQERKGSGATDRWVNPQAVLRYKASDRVSVAGRVEYYDDRNGVIVSPTGAGFRSWGVSANADVAILDNLLWRIELRTLGSRDPVFADRNGSLGDGNTAVTTSLAVSF